MKNSLEKNDQIINDLPEVVKNAIRRIDRNNPLPLYQQLYDVLFEVITNGELREGSFFATESLLRSETQMSRSTIRKALEELVRQKHLVRITGKGTFVSVTAPREAAVYPDLKSMTQDFKEKGLNPGSILLQSNKVIPPKEVAKKLHLSPKEEVLYIERVRTGNNIPILYLQGYIPLKIGINDLENIPNSLYQLIESCGRTIHSATHIINATNTPPEVAKHLGVKKSTAGLTMERVTYDQDDIPVIYEEGIFRSDLYEYKLIMKHNEG